MSHPDEERAIGDAIRTHCARRSLFLRRTLHQLVRRGLLSLGIGLSFLGLHFVTAQVTGLIGAESGLRALLREGMLIVGGWRCGGRWKCFSTTGGQSSASGV